MPVEFQASEFHELYLRELPRVDLDDDEAILGFMELLPGYFGLDPTVRGAYHDVGPLPYFPDLWSDVNGPWPVDAAELARFVEIASLKPDRRRVEEFRLGTAWLRDLTRIYRDSRDGMWDFGERDGDHKGTYEVFPYHPTDEDGNDAWESDFIPPPGEGSNAIWYLVSGLNAGVRRFQPRLRVTREDGMDYATASVPWCGAYHAMALQLFEHVAGYADIKECANESCRRLFVEQVDRASEGHHKTDRVIYCRKACARIQATREYRRRKRSIETR